MTLGDGLPGDEIGMMFQQADDDLVARLQEGHRIAVGDQIDCLGGGAGEDDLVWRRAQEGGDDGAGALIGLSRGFTQRIDAAMDIGVAGLIEVAQTIQHDFRLLGAGGAIEISNRPAGRIAAGQQGKGIARNQRRDTCGRGGAGSK